MKFTEKQMGNLKGSLTEKEISILNVVLDNAESQCGAKDLNELSSDNYNWISFEEIVLESSKNYSKAQVIGILASLSHKNVMVKEKRPKKDGGYLWYINIDFINEMK